MDKSDLTGTNITRVSVNHGRLGDASLPWVTDSKVGTSRRDVRRIVLNYALFLNSSFGLSITQVKTAFSYSLLCLGFFLLSSSVYSLEDNISIESRFSPSVIQEGQQTLYEIQIRGDMNIQVEGQLPITPGLTINPNGSQSRGIKSINGKTSPYTLYSFAAKAAQKGSYEVPKWEIKIDGKQYTVTSARLDVIDRGELYKQLAFLELEIPKTPVYVGQLFPVEIKLYLLSDARLTGLGPFEKESVAFTQNFIEEPKEYPGQKNGKQYRVIHTSAQLVGLKSGAQLIDYNVQLRIVLPGSSSRSSDPFDSFSLFEDFSSFFDKTRGELLEISEEIELTILPLPQENKPESFSGGVGDFSLETTASNTALNLGDAVSLQITVEGEGNLDSISAPVFPETPGLKIYPPQRTEKIDAEVAGSNKAVVFQYTIIPESEKINQIPPAAFSYFDPKQERYQTITTKPVPIAVTGAGVSQIESNKESLTSTLSVNRLSNKIPAEKVNLEINPIAKTEDTLSSFKPNILDITINPILLAFTQPTFIQQRFIIAQFFCLLLIVGAMILWQRLSHAKSANYKKEIEVKKAVKHYLNEARKAIRSNQPERFFEKAQKSVQIIVTKDLKLTDHSLGFSQLQTILSSYDSRKSLRKELQLFWNKAEAIRFGGNKSLSYNLQEEEKTLLNLIKELEKIV